MTRRGYYAVDFALECLAMTMRGEDPGPERRKRLQDDEAFLKKLVETKSTFFQQLGPSAKRLLAGVRMALHADGHRVAMLRHARECYQAFGVPFPEPNDVRTDTTSAER